MSESEAPTAPPGQGPNASIVAGPANHLARQATAWTVVAYLLVPVSMLMDGAEDGGIVPTWEPGWFILLLLLAGAWFAAAVVMAWRAARPGPGCTTGSRRRFRWLLVLAGVPAVWILGGLFLLMVTTDAF